MRTDFNPVAYSTQLNRRFNAHAVGSVVTFIASILSASNEMFAGLIFQETLNTALQNNTKEHSLFNKIAYPIYCVLLLIPLSMALFITCFSFRTLQNKSDDDHAENKRLIEKYHQTLDSLIKSYSAELRIDDHIEVRFIDNINFKRAAANQGCFCMQRNVLVSTGFLKFIEDGNASLELTLAHELVHFKRDLPQWSVNDLVPLLLRNTEILLRFYQLPIQIAYFIAGTIVFGFKPAFAYTLAVAFILTVINGFSAPHRARLMETRADFESLFSGIRFSNGEHQKQINLFSAVKINEQSRCLSFFALFYPRTHPSKQDRADMVRAAVEYYGQNSTSVNSVRVQQTDESSALLSRAANCSA